jgi:myosin heavy subunit
MHEDESNSSELEELLEDINFTAEDVNLTLDEINLKVRDVNLSLEEAQSGTISCEIDPKHPFAHDLNLSSLNQAIAEVEEFTKQIEALDKQKEREISEVEKLKKELNSNQSKYMKTLSQATTKQKELEFKNRVIEKLKESHEKQRMIMDAEKQEQLKKANIEIENMKKQLEEQQNLNKKQVEILHQKDIEKMKRLSEKKENSENQIEDMKTTLEDQNNELEKLRNELEEKNNHLQNKISGFERESLELKKLLLEEKLNKNNHVDKKYIKKIKNRGYLVHLVTCHFKAGEGSLGIKFNTTERGIYVNEIIKGDTIFQVAKYPEVKKGCLLYEVQYFKRGSKTGGRLKSKKASDLI